MTKPVRQQLIDGEAPDNLSVGGDLDLSGTKISALPDNLSVGGGLYLRGTGFDPIYRDERNYDLYPACLPNGDFWWAAGCRVFKSTKEALAHWGGGDYPVPSRGQMFCEAIRKYEEQSK